MKVSMPQSFGSEIFCALVLVKCVYTSLCTQIHSFKHTHPSEMHNDDYTTMPECGDLQRADTHNSAEVGCVFSCSALKHVLESTSKLRRVVHAVAGSCFTNVHQYSEYVHTLSGCILYYICFRCPCFCSKILEDRVALKISCESDLCSSCASTLIFCPDGRKC